MSTDSDWALAAHRGLDAVERLEQHRGVGLAVAAGIFGEEPAAARGLHHGGLDRLVVVLAQVTGVEVDSEARR